VTVKRTLVFTTRLTETREYRVELRDDEEMPSEGELAAGIQEGLVPYEEEATWDTVAEDQEHLVPDSLRVVEEGDGADGRTRDEAWWDAHEDEVMEEIATGERDSSGRRP
jgi:hypothetical protein